jgi:hypothetical protein
VIAGADHIDLEPEQAIEEAAVQHQAASDGGSAEARVDVRDIERSIARFVLEVAARDADEPRTELKSVGVCVARERSESERRDGAREMP